MHANTIVLKNNDIFMVTDESGNFPTSRAETGLFWQGTRFLHMCTLLLENHTPILLTRSVADTGDRCQIDFTNPTLCLQNADKLEEHSIHIQRQWQIKNHQVMQTFSLTNYHAHPVTLQLSLKFGADFHDIFEIRGVQRERPGQLLPSEVEPALTILSYCGRDKVLRQTCLESTPPAEHVSAEELSWQLHLPKNQAKQVSVTITMSQQAEEALVPASSHSLNGKNALRDGSLPSIHTHNPMFNKLVTRSLHDLVMMSTQTEHGLYPYGGIPWFVCPFGRDGLITSLEFLPWFPEVTRGTLAFLAHYQGTREEMFTDEEPGKILHEFRTGELANCREIPYIPYYGSIDSTLLFLVTLGAYMRWTNDLTTLQQLWPHAKAAAHWIKVYGDQDGDAFLESRTLSQKGLVNQGWKDSWDSISHRDGTLAEAPIALCEVQSYTYSAYKTMSYLANQLGETEDAACWSQAASHLQERFLRTFWWETENTFFLALDGAKKPCEVVTSNAGQCLWSGIVPDELAEKMIPRLLADDIYSGWGIRTLSQHAARYNPMSYHNGSIWPHDNAIIGAGFARYGKKAEAAQLLKGLTQLGAYYDATRLPELFGGFAREDQRGPIPYPAACVPQSWAAGAPLLLLSSILGLEADAPNKRLYVQPTLPDWLPDLEIKRLRVGDSTLHLRFWREGEQSRWSVLDNYSSKKEDAVEVLDELVAPGTSLSY